MLLWLVFLLDRIVELHTLHKTRREPEQRWRPGMTVWCFHLKIFILHYSDWILKAIHDIILVNKLMRGWIRYPQLITTDDQYIMRPFLRMYLQPKRQKIKKQQLQKRGVIWCTLTVTEHQCEPVRLTVSHESFPAFPGSDVRSCRLHFAPQGSKLGGEVWSVWKVCSVRAIDTQTRFSSKKFWCRTLGSNWRSGGLAHTSLSLLGVES